MMLAHHDNRASEQQIMQICVMPHQNTYQGQQQTSLGVEYLHSLCSVRQLASHKCPLICLKKGLGQKTSGRESGFHQRLLVDHPLIGHA